MPKVHRPNLFVAYPQIRHFIALPKATPRLISHLICKGGFTQRIINIVDEVCEWQSLLPGIVGNLEL